MDGFFRQERGIYIGNAGARGPWSANHCHAGPATGLIARTLEAAICESKMLMKLSVDFLRPIPMDGLRVEYNILKDGTTVTVAAARLLGVEGTVLANATSTHVKPRDIGQVVTGWDKPKKLIESVPAKFPVRGVLHGETSFADVIEVMMPKAETAAPGPTSLWMKTPSVVSGATPSSFERLCPLADCGNGISRNEELESTTFMNTDLTICRFRRSESEWLNSDAKSFWCDNGVGVSWATISDEIGPLAVVSQSLLLNRQKRSA